MARRVLTIFILFAIILASAYEGLIWLIPVDSPFPLEGINLGILIFALLGFFILSGSRKKKDRHNKVVIKDDKDSILISEPAIIQMVRNALINVTALVSSDIKVHYSKDNKISLKLEVVLQAGSDVVEATKQIEEQIHGTFSAFLEDRLANIQVTIQGFKEMNPEK